MSKKRGLSILIIFMSSLVLAMVITILSSSDNTAQAAPPLPPRPRPTPVPSAGLYFSDLDKVYDPNPVVPGKTLTYSLRLQAQGPLDGASEINFDLQLLGNQQYVSLDAGNTGWTYIGQANGLVTINVGRVKQGYDATAKIITTAPSDISRAILSQSIYLRWVDSYSAKQVEYEIKAAVVSQSNNTPLPPAPVVSTPTTSLPISGPFAPQAAPVNTSNFTQGDVWYFSATRHYLGFGFLAYWKEHGSVTNLGWPVSEEFLENGQTVQFFERGVLEYHPENHDPFRVLLRALGSEAGEADPMVIADTAPDDGAQYYADTGHWISGKFIKTWQKNGGLMQFGFPIGEATLETTSNGGSELVQWFERARFELDLTRPNQLVTFGLVGRESAVFKGYLPY